MQWTLILGSLGNIGVMTFFCNASITDGCRGASCEVLTRPPQSVNVRR